MAGYKVQVGACDPKGCGYRCQALCPKGVFLAVPRRRLKDHGIEPDYRIVPRFAHFCNGCRDCVTGCPGAVIQVSGRRARVPPPRRIRPASPSNARNRA